MTSLYVQLRQLGVPGAAAARPGATLGSLLSPDGIARLADWLRRETGVAMTLAAVTTVGQVDEWLRGAPRRQLSFTPKAPSCFVRSCSVAVGHEASDTVSFARLLLGDADLVQSHPPPQRNDLVDTAEAGAFFAASNVEQFDAAFWSLTERECRRLDPRHRFMLTHAWYARESAGRAPGKEDDATGVFVGLWCDMRELFQGSVNSSSLAQAPGVAEFLAACLGLSGGPALLAGSGGSSGLAALGLAWEALRRDSCRSALVASASLVVATKCMLNRLQSSLSPSGRCRSFDAAADGVARAEGCVALLLDTQKENAMMQLESVTLGGSLARAAEFVEANGCGIAARDADEWEALNGVLRVPTVVGCVKSNTGHAGATAGLVGLARLACLFQSGRIGRHLHFERLNPAVAPGLIVIAAEAIDGSAIERASLSSRSLSGGSNVHAVLSRHVAAPHGDRAPEMEQMVVAAKTPSAALAMWAAAMQQQCEAPPQLWRGRRVALWQLPIRLSGLCVGREVHSCQEVYPSSASLTVVCPGHGWRAARGWRGQVQSLTRLVDRSSGRVTVAGAAALALDLWWQLQTFGGSRVAAKLLGWGVGALVKDCIENGVAIEGRQVPPFLGAPIFSDSFVLELGRTSVGRRGGVWLHALSPATLESDLGVFGFLPTALVAPVAYAFEPTLSEDAAAAAELRVDVRHHYDPSCHLLRGEPILPSAFHIVILCDRQRPPPAALCFADIELVSPLLVTGSSADVYYARGKGENEWRCATADNRLLFSARVEPLAALEETVPKWLRDAFAASSPRTASFHHPQIQCSGEFCWRARESFGGNWSVAELVAPADGGGGSGIGLLDSVFSQCVMSVEARHEVCRLGRIRRLAVAANAFSAKRYTVFVRVGVKDVDAWLCEAQEEQTEEQCGRVVVRVEGLLAEALHLEPVSALEVGQTFYEMQWLPLTAVNAESVAGAKPLFSAPLVIGSDAACVAAVAQRLPSAVQRIVDCEDGGQLLQPADVLTVNLFGAGRPVRRRDVRLCAQLLRAAAALEACMVYTVTRRCHRINGEALDPAIFSPWARAIWSLGRSVPSDDGRGLAHALVDVDELSAVAVAAAPEIRPGSETAFRQGQAFRAVLAPCRARDWPPASGHFLLTFAERGAIGNLEFLAVPEPTGPAPEPGSVRVRVEASALNLRDVLNVMGLYSGDAGRMGLEFAGVTDDAARQRTFGLAGGVSGASSAFGSTVVTRLEYTAALPASVTMEEAATVPFVFCNALGALELAGSLRGRTVLITAMHVCYGGVGVALTQACRRDGARRVFEVAGKSSRSYIRSWGADVVVTYGDPSFFEAILEGTGGAGVDVCLNTVIGADYADRSMGCLAEHGEWIELGRWQIQNEAQFAARRPAARYATFAFDELVRSSPGRVQQLLATLAADLDSGALSPIAPRVFPLRKARDAFQATFQASFVGKIVFRHPPAQPLPPGLAVFCGALRGGTVALLAEKLTGRPHVLVDSRRARGGAGGVSAALLLNGQDRQVVALCDGAEETLVAVATAKQACGEARVGLVLQGDGEDSEEEEKSDRTDEPFVLGRSAGVRAAGRLGGARLLLLSSVAALLGDPLQPAAAAAGGFLEGLAERDGRAQCLCWGPWEGRGRLLRSGARFSPFPRREAAAATEAVLRGGGSLGVMRVAWEELCRQRFSETREVMDAAESVIERLARRVLRLDPDEPIPPTFGGFDDADLQARLASLAQQLRGVGEEASQRQLARTVLQSLAQQLGMRRLDAGAARAPLLELGLSSLDLVALGDHVRSAFAVACEEFFFFEHGTLETAAMEIARRIADKTAAAAVPSLDALSFGLFQSIPPVAVAGLSFRLPGAREPALFWERLLRASDSVRTFVPRGTAAAGEPRFAGLCDWMSGFDCAFFHVSPLEASVMDPQHRVVLEEVRAKEFVVFVFFSTVTQTWRAIEDAGVTPQSLARKHVSVFVGVSKNDYAELMREEGYVLFFFVPFSHLLCAAAPSTHSCRRGRCTRWWPTASATSSIFSARALRWTRHALPRWV